MPLAPGRYTVSNVWTKRWIGVADFQSGAEEPTTARRPPNRTELLRTVEDPHFAIEVLSSSEDSYSFAFGGILPVGDGVLQEDQLRVSYYATIRSNQYTIWWKDLPGETSSWRVDKVKDEDNVYTLQVSNNVDQFAFNDSFRVSGSTGNTHYSIQLAPLRTNDPAFHWRFEKA